jgi:divinyl protochlorophyllide a 8-vinyl-reductase
VTAPSATLPGRSHAPGRIGPNALTQLLPLLETAGGAELKERLLARAGVVELPDMTGLIDEAPVARLHQAMRAELPDRAPGLAFEAGARTADYILAHRIPRAVQAVLRPAPAWVAGPVLSRAIAKNAWTFAGSGRFEVERAWPAVFLIHDNPVVRGERGERPLCHWHRGVFERLFRSLVTDRARVSETACCACGAEACRFEVGAGG